MFFIKFPMFFKAFLLFHDMTFDLIIIIIIIIIINIIIIIIIIINIVIIIIIIIAAIKFAHSAYIQSKYIQN